MNKDRLRKSYHRIISNSADFLVPIMLLTLLALPLFKKEDIAVAEEETEKIEPYIYTYFDYPGPYIYDATTTYGSFGHYRINITYYKSWINESIEWVIKQSTDKITWKDYENYVIKEEWIDTECKFTIIVNSDMDAYYSVAFNIKNSFTNYKDLSESIDNPSNDFIMKMDPYEMKFNWDDYKNSDISSISTMSKSIAQNKFQWMVISNNIVRDGDLFVVDPTYGEIGDAAIDSWEWDAEEGTFYSSNSLVRLGDSNYFMISAAGDTGTDYDGFLRVMEVNDDGTFVKALVDTWEYDDSDGKYASILHISGDIYAIFYQDASNDEIFTTRAWSSNGTLQKTKLYSKTLTQGSGMNMVHVTGDIYALSYMESSPGYDHFLETYSIDSTTGEISNRIDVVEYDQSSSSQTLTIVPYVEVVDSDTIAIVYSWYAGYDGRLVTYNISAAGDITNDYADYWEFEGIQGLYPKIKKIGTNVFAITYKGPSGHGYASTLSISDAGAITKSWIDSLDFDTSCTYVSPVITIGEGSVYAVAYSGVGADGFIKTFNMSSDGTIGDAIIDYIEFDTSDNVYYAQVEHIYGDNYVVIYTGNGNDGWAKTVEILTPSSESPQVLTNCTHYNAQPQNNTGTYPIAGTINVSINQPEGKPYNWSIELGSQSNSGSTSHPDSNGTFTLNYSGLPYKTWVTYWHNSSVAGKTTKVYHKFKTNTDPSENASAPLRNCTIHHVEPDNNTVGININLKMNFSISQPQGLKYNWTASWVGFSNSGSNYNGTLSLNFTNLPYKTWIYPNISTDCSGNWTTQNYSFKTKVDPSENATETFGIDTYTRSSSICTSVGLEYMRGQWFEVPVDCNLVKMQIMTGTINATIRLQGAAYDYIDYISSYAEHRLDTTDIVEILSTDDNKIINLIFANSTKLNGGQKYYFLVRCVDAETTDCYIKSNYISDYAVYDSNTTPIHFNYALTGETSTSQRPYTVVHYIASKVLTNCTYHNIQPLNSTSITQPVAFTINTSIYQPQGKPYNWTIELGGQSNSGNMQNGNGTWTLNISGLEYGSNNTYWINSSCANKTTIYWGYFITNNNIPEISNPYPVNESIDIDINTNLSINISDSNNDYMNLMFYSNISNTYTSSGVSIVNTSLNRMSSTRLPYTRLCVYSEPQKLWYQFFADGESFYNGNLYYRTSSDGISWSTQKIAMNETGYTTAGVDIAHDPETDDIHIVYMYNFNPSKYRKGHLEEGSISWYAPVQENILTDGFDDTQDPVICIDSNGYPWIAWENDTSNNPYITTSSSKDGTWTKVDGYPMELSTDNDMWIDITPLNNGKIYAFYWYGINDPGSSGNVKGRLYNGTGWEAEETVASGLCASEYYGGACIVSRNNDVFACWTNSFTGTSTIDIYYAKRTWGEDWSTPTVIINEVYDNMDSETCPILAINNNSELFVFFIDDTEDVRYKYAFVGCNNPLWSDSVKIAMDESMYVYTHGCQENFSDGKLGIYYLNGTEEGSFTAKFLLLNETGIKNWTKIYEYTNVKNGIYYVNSSKMGIFSEYYKKYYWNISVNDGKGTSNNNFWFSTIGPPIIETWHDADKSFNCTIINLTSWYDIDKSFNTTVENITKWHDADSNFNVTIENNTIWHDSDKTFNTTIVNITKWHDADKDFNCTLNNITIESWHDADKTFNCTIINITKWHDVDTTFNTTVVNITYWHDTDNSFNVTVINNTKWHDSDKSFNITIVNITKWHDIDKSFNCTLNNISIPDTWHDADKTFNCSIINITKWYDSDNTFNVTIENVTHWHDSDITFNVTIENITLWHDADKTFNTTVLNITKWHDTDKEFNCIVNNVSANESWHDADRSFNCSIVNITSWHEADSTFNITINNITHWHDSDTTFNCTITNIERWHDSDKSFNCTINNITYWHDINKEFNCTLINITEETWHDTDKTFNCTILNITHWHNADTTFNSTIINISGKPVFGSPNPSNNSIIHVTSINWTINISSPNGLFTWYINASNGQNNSGINDGNGIKNIILTGLQRNNLYTIWVNASNSVGWTRHYYVFRYGNEDLSVHFTYQIGGHTVTVSPVVGADVDYYKWIIDDGVKGETDWINVSDIDDYIYGLLEGDTYKITLIVKNETTQNSTYRNIDIPNYIDIQTVEEEPISIIEEPGKYHNIIDEWNLSDIIKGFLGEDPMNKMFFIVLIVIIVVLLLALFNERKKIRFLFIKKKKDPPGDPSNNRTVRYATTHRGKHRFEIGSEEDRYLHTHNLPHSHVTIKNGKKTIKRY